MSIGSNMKNIRKEKNMTLQQIADKMNCSPQNIAQYENDKRIPKLETTKKIAAALEVPFLELMDTMENIVETSVSVLTNAAENTGETISDISNRMKITSKDEQAILYDYQKLNEIGKKEAKKRVSELTEIPRYTQKKQDITNQVQHDLYGQD